MIPVLPFKIIGFSECKHLIIFLEDDEFDAVEIMQYGSGVSGKGEEIIFTKKDNSQEIFTNSKITHENLIKSGRIAELANIEYKMKEGINGLYIDVICSNENHTAKLNFESLFPVSKVREGIVDPRRHSSEVLPFMFSSNNTVGKKCKVVIDDKSLNIRKAEDPILKQFGGIDAYFSGAFYMGVLSPQKNKIKFVKTKNNVQIFEDSNGDVFKAIPCSEGFNLQYNNYNENINYHITTLETGMKNIQLFDNDKEQFSFNFREPLNFLEEKQKGECTFEICNLGVKFDCQYKSETKKIKECENHYIFKNNFSITYINEEWEEKKRRLSIISQFYMNSNMRGCIGYDLCSFALEKG